MQKLLLVLVASPVPAAVNFEAPLAQLRNLHQLMNAPSMASMAASPSTPPLTVIAASQSAQVHMVPVIEVLYFEAADKHVRVLTGKREYLIRTPIKELARQLPTQRFWQIHQDTLVQTSAIASVARNTTGRLQVQLRDQPKTLPSVGCTHTFSRRWSLAQTMLCARHWFDILLIALGHAQHRQAAAERFR